MTPRRKVKSFLCRKAQSCLRLSDSLTWLRKQRGADWNEDGRSRPEFQCEIRHLEELGNYFSEYYNHTDGWMLRRVDTIELVDSNIGDTATKSSVTIDGRAVTRIRNRWKISPNSEVHLPLPAVPKQLLGHFDTAYDSKPIPVLTSVDNAHAAVGILLVKLLEEGIPATLVRPELIDFLFRIASCSKRDPFYSFIIEKFGPNGDDSGKFGVETNWRQADENDAESFEKDEELLQEIFDSLLGQAGAEKDGVIPEFAQMLYDFLVNFIPIGVLPRKCLSHEFIVKTYMVSTSAEHFRGEDAYPIIGLPVDLKLRSAGMTSIFAGGALVSWMAAWSNRALIGLCLVLVACAVIVNIRIHWSSEDRLVGIKYIIGAVAYNLYAALNLRFAVLQLSGCYRLASRNTNLGLYGSQHYRLAIPEGAHAISAQIDITDGRSEDSIDPNVESDEIENWVAAHRTNGDPSRRFTSEIKVLVLPRSQSLLKNSFYAALVTFCLLMTGVFSHIGGWFLKEFAAEGSGNYGLDHLVVRSSGAIVTVLMIAPSIYTIILLKQDEHKFVSNMLATMRRVVGVCAILSASVAIPLALDLPTTVTLIWWVCGLAVSAFSCWHIAATRFYHGLLAKSANRFPELLAA